MKALFKRCMSCVLCFFLILAYLVLPTHAISTECVKSSPWNYVKIYGEDSTDVIPNTVIIYLHGDCNSGSESVSDLEILADADHPYQYAKKDLLPLPDDVLIVCPQTHYDGEFLKKYDKLYEFIHYWAETYPDAKIILGGHSRGGMTTYFVANKGNSEVDGFFFISTKKPDEADQLQFIENAFVAYGTDDNVYRRHYFSNLFSFDISDERFAKKNTIWNEETNNVYYVDEASHPDAPKLMLEDIFWQWLCNVPND